MSIIKDYDDDRHGLLADAVRPVDKKETGDVVLSRKSALVQMLEAGGANITAHYIAQDGAETSEKITADAYADLCDPNGPNYARKGWLRIDYEEVNGLGFLPVCVESKRYYFDGERIKRDNGTAEKVTFTIDVDKTRYDADTYAGYVSLDCGDLKTGTKVTYEWEPTPCGWLVVRCNIAIPNDNGGCRDNHFTFDITV